MRILLDECLPSDPRLVKRLPTLFFRPVIILLRILGLLVLALGIAVSGPRAENQEMSDAVIHGTLNVVFANSHGFVVVTDSMQTVGSGLVLRDPGKKLFQLDDRTVCTIAGFGWETFGSAPEFNTSAAGLIEKYQSELAQNPGKHTFAEKLTSLGFLFKFYLSSAANIHDIVHGPLASDHYIFQLLLAGYDVDGTPKMGSFTLRTTVKTGRDGQPIFESITEQIEEFPIGKELSSKLAGQPDVAEDILRHPEKSADDPSIARYASSLVTDRGSSLTLKDMEKLAEVLLRRTEKKYPSVGGPRQVALLRGGKVESLRQPEFPKHALPLPGFNLVVGSHFEGPRGIVFGGNIIALFVRNYFKNDDRSIAGHYFFGNEFVDSIIRYDGGPTRFDSSNTVRGSILVLGVNADLRSEVVRHLMKDFAWREVRQLKSTDSSH